MMKRFIRVAMLLCMGTVLLSALSFKTIEAKAATASGKVFQNRFSSTSCGKWSAVPSPNATALRAVTALSANDVWAAGNTIIHWDGSVWRVVFSAGGATCSRRASSARFHKRGGRWK